MRRITIFTKVNFFYCKTNRARARDSEETPWKENPNGKVKSFAWENRNGKENLTNFPFPL